MRWQLQIFLSVAMVYSYPFATSNLPNSIIFDQGTQYVGDDVVVIVVVVYDDKEAPQNKFME
jgi:hypothetical protein